MDIVKPKKHIDYGKLRYLIDKYSELFVQTDLELKTVAGWVPPDETRSIEAIRTSVQTCAILYLATLEECFDYVKREK